MAIRVFNFGNLTFEISLYASQNNLCVLLKKYIQWLDLSHMCGNDPAVEKYYKKVAQFFGIYDLGDLLFEDCFQQKFLDHLLKRQDLYRVDIFYVRVQKLPFVRPDGKWRRWKVQSGNIAHHTQ